MKEGLGGWVMVDKGQEKIREGYVKTKGYLGKSSETRRPGNQNRRELQYGSLCKNSENSTRSE